MPALLLLLLSGETYAEARARAVLTDVPLVVVVTADWCAPCQTLKSRLAGWKDRTDIAYTVVDWDDAVRPKIVSGGSIPQTHVYRRHADGSWTHKSATGLRTAREIEQLWAHSPPSDTQQAPADATSVGICCGRRVTVNGKFVGVFPDTREAWESHLRWHGVDPTGMDEQAMAQAHADAHKESTPAVTTTNAVPQRRGVHGRLFGRRRR